MSTTQKIYLTVQGKHKYEQDLARLYNYLQKVARRMRLLRQRKNIDNDGDWQYTMNEYDYATKRIDELEKVLENCKILRTHGKRERADLGSIVRCQNTTSSHQFKLVDAVEANPAEGKISVQSPLGQALLGKRASDEVYVTTPSGQQHYIIQEVT